MNRWLRIARSALIALPLLCGSLGAHAQTADPQRIAAAQTLYEQATTDMDAKRYAQACPRLEEVVRLVPDGLGAKFTLAQCYEALGKRASAWSQYATVESLAVKAGQLERAQRAAEKAAELRPTLATLAIEVPVAVRAIPGVSIERDGTAIGEVQWGVAVPLDAGAHTVVVSAPGRESATTRFNVAADGQHLTVIVSEPRLPSGAPPAPREPERPYQLPLGIVALGLGAAGLTAGAVLGGRAIADNDESQRDGHCDAADQCDLYGLELRERARDYANGSTAAFIAGGIVAAGGVVLVATVPGDDEPEVELSAGGIRVRGSW